MRHSHHQSRARVRVQHQPYPSAIFGTQASFKNATGHVRCFLRAVTHMLFLYLILLLAVWISSQLITPPSGAEVPVSDPDWPNPHLFNDSMDDVWRHVEQDEECFHCLFEEWMKDDPGMSDLLSCPLSDEVTTIPVHVRSTHVLSMKHCTAFNAMIRRMTILVITFLRQMAVFLLVTFLGLSALFHEEMLAHSATRKKGKKDAFSPRRKDSAFEFIFVPSPFTIGVAVVKRYKRLAVYKKIHNLLLKFPSLKLWRRTKFVRRIHGQLVVSFTIRRSCVMRIRFRPPSFCLALLRCIAHLVKEVLARSVSVMPSVLLCGLLLQAGDVEVNPGPIHGGGTFPLSSWNNDALLFLRERLKYRVLMNTGLSAKLETADGGFMSANEARKIRELPSSSAQVDKVIETLRGKGDRDFKTFCRMLCNSNQMVWADELKRAAEQFKRVEERTGGGEREQVDSFSSRLVKFYMSMKVVEDEWIPADQGLPFVNLALARFHLSAQRAQEMFVEAVREGADNVYTYQTGKVEFKEIPGLVKKHKLVIISGAPGVGKSTLARKICQDICQTSGCHGYIFVILVELRDLLHFKKDFQLVDILQLFQGIMTYDVSLARLSEVLYSNLGRGVLFILDGFDELPPDLRQSDFLVNLLSHNRNSLLRHCDIILTSRSIVTNEIYHQMQKSRSQVSLTNIEVLGFTQDQIKICAKQYFTDQGRPDLFDLFVQKIGAVPHIRGLCSIPVVLSIISQVFLFREDLPPTLTQIYNDYLCVKVLKYSEDLPEFDSILDLPKDHDIYKLGEIAYNCIKEQKVVFDSADLQDLGERFSDRKRGCGVLTARPIRYCSRSRRGVIERFFFIHLTIQEFLAAVYVSLLTVDWQCVIWARYLGEPHMAQVWRFYCGLTKLQHFDRLQDKIDSYPADLQIQCLFETQDISLVRRLMPRIVGEKVIVKPETAYDSTAYGYCLGILPSLKHLTIEKGASSAQIHRLLEPVFVSGILQALHLPKGTDWGELEVALDRLVSLERAAFTDGAFKGHFGKVNLTEPPLSTIVKLLCLQHVTEIECQHIQGCEAMDHEVLMKMEWSLSGNKTMNKLTLSNVHGVTLPRQFCHQLLLGIRRNYSLSEVSLSLNPQNWCCPDDVTAGKQGSVQHLTLKGAPVDAFINLLSFFNEVKELKCHSIHPPQENMRDEELDMKLRDIMQGLAGMRQLKKLIIGMDVNFPNHLMVGVGQYLLQSISRSKLSLAVFALYGHSNRERLLLDILMRVSPDERKMFASGKYGHSYPCIRLSHGTDEDFSDDDSIDGAEDDNNKAHGTDEDFPDDDSIGGAEGFTETDCSTLYHKAINDNPTITLHVAKAMTIGPPQVGKTSLRRRLLELPQPAISVSTDVMRVAETVNLCHSAGTTSSGEAGVVPSVDKSSDSDDSDDYLSKRIASRCTYEACTYMPAGDKWVTVNSTSGIHSLLMFLQMKLDDSSTQVHASMKSEDWELEAPIQPSSDTLPIANNPDSLVKGSLSANVPQLPSVMNTTLPTSQEVQQPSDVSVNPELVEDMIHQMFQKLQERDVTSVTLPDAYLLQFLDCGGQLAYHDILPLFVNIPAIYLHVFDITKELNECPIDELCSTTGQKKYSAKSPLSVAEMIKRSAITVHSLADKKVQLPSEVCVPGTSTKPRIVLVGTHLDEVGEEDQDAKLKAINETLRKTLQSESHDLRGMVMINKKSRSMFFPVANEVDKTQSCKECKSKHLKKRIREQAMKDAVKVEVPVRWYLRQLLEISRGEKKPLYTYGELYQLSKGEGSVADIGEFHAMITYFHALGLLLHLCGADVKHNEDSDCLVFTSPSYLFENISKLYQVQFEEEVEGKGKIMLKSQGRLTKDALEDLNIDKVHLDHGRFMDLLIQLFIGARIKSDEGVRTLFVPSVLTNSAEDRTTFEDAVLSRGCTLHFAITFKSTSFIPCGVFTGMIARLQSEPGWGICTSSITRTGMKFTVGQSTVFLLDHAMHISVEIGSNEELEHGQYQVYRDAIIKATADSYCFLFHSKAAKDHQSGTCSMCMERPYLVLGASCQSCPPQPVGTHLVQHFAKLKVENCAPKSVHCSKQNVVKPLKSALEQVPFQNISHCAVVEDQHTSPSHKVVEPRKPPTHVHSKTVHTAEQVLDTFRDQFVKDMDAKAVVMDLLNEGIIDDGDLEQISSIPDPKQRNQRLHLCLKQKCTDDALNNVCDVIAGVKGNAKMKELGKAMKRTLESRCPPFAPSQPLYNIYYGQMFPGPSGVPYHPHAMGQYQGMANYPNMMQPPLMTMPWQWPQVPPGTHLRPSSDAPGPSGINAPAPPPAPPTGLACLLTGAHLTSCDSPGPSRITPPPPAPPTTADVPTTLPPPSHGLDPLSMKQQAESDPCSSKRGISDGEGGGQR